MSCAITAKLICGFVFAYAKKQVFSLCGSCIDIQCSLLVHVCIEDIENLSHKVI